LGAARVIAIDRFPERLALARSIGATTVDYSEDDLSVLVALMHNYMKPLLDRVEKGQIDPSYVISHPIGLDQAPEMYQTWRDKKDNVTKIVIDPGGPEIRYEADPTDSRQ
jgi:threonine dehydrogenase-like Zn-dependent dehydrogenase